MRIIDADSLKNNVKKYGRYAADKDTWLIERFIETIDEEESVSEFVDKSSSSDYNKYKWHDLSKNPNDLPKVNTFVQCVWVGSSHNWYDVFLFDDDPRPHFKNTLGNMISIIGDEKFTYEGQVLAWKEIEPFEVKHE